MLVVFWQFLWYNYLEILYIITQLIEKSGDIMRDQFSIIFVFLIIALGSCSLAAMKSRRIIGSSVALLTLCLTPPIIGNLIIIRSESFFSAKIGYYIYFLGMDLLIWSMLKFVTEYCNYKWKKSKLRFVLEFLSLRLLTL